ncbi:SAM-dependent methyltransferase [Actinocrispum sp. NPDC049592]|uniref:SAM-dependent methyltransferase n=1 Tax=Actinocrispum sp. NPDC049592 TaxID=3154835 RepID=UPI0034389D37
MTLDPVAQTSRLTAALRARESARPDALFTDPFAARLAGEAGTALLAEFGDNSTIAVRTRFFDDVITAAEARQLVILAAGMDSRAFRLALPEDAELYEVDRPEVLRLKDSLITEAPVCRRVSVGADLTGDWAEPLLAAGFEQGRPTCWLAEGVMQYLAAVDVAALLDRVTGLSAAGSLLLTDFVGQSLLDSPALRPMLELFAAHDMTWRFGTDQPEELLEPLGWRADVVLISEVGTALNRWPFPAAARNATGVGQGYFVRARC